MRIEIQIRDREMHEQAERGLAAHWAYKEGKPQADIHVPWVDDLVEILDHAESPEELLEHTRMAMYQDRIFAFTPKGELIQLPKGATPVDFAYAVHTDLGDRTVGAKVNGRVVPLRTMLENGDQVEILASEAQHPQPSWLRFVATGKARAGVRRFVRHKEREETVELGRKIYDEIVARLPAELDKDALKRALKKLKIENEDELMIAIARKRVSDEALMEALMPGSAGGDVAPRPLGQRKAISIKGLTPGVAYHLAAMLPPDPRRPHRRPAARGRGDRGPRHRLRHAGERDRRRLARPRLGRRLGRRRGAAGGDPARHSRARSARCRASSAPSTPTSSTFSWSTATAASRPSTSTSRCTTSRTCTRSSPRCATPSRSAQRRADLALRRRLRAAGARGRRRRRAPQA